MASNLAPTVNGQRPLVSIVIPSYNAGRFLPDAVQSALAQTYRPCEVIVVDDGSTDDTAEVLAHLGDRARSIRQLNFGAAAARNAGIRAALGEVICFLDADDLLHPDCVAERMKLMMADEQVGVVSGSFRTVGENLDLLPEKRQRWTAPKGGSRWLFLREAWSPMCGLLVRKRALELCGEFDPLLPTAEDFDLQIRLTRRFKIEYDPVARADYRQVAGSASRDFQKTYDGLVAVYRKNAAYESSRMAYGWNAFWGLFIQVAGSVFGKAAAEGGMRSASATAWQIGRRHPKALLFYLMWLLRAGWNRLLWTLGFGPLRSSRRGGQ